MNWRNAALFLVSSILIACGTVAPKPVESQSIGFSGNNHNNGVGQVITDDKGNEIGVEVDQRWLNQYNNLISFYGDDPRFFITPVQKNEGVVSFKGASVVTKHGWEISLKLTRIRNSNIEPRLGWVKALERAGIL